MMDCCPCNLLVFGVLGGASARQGKGDDDETKGIECFARLGFAFAMFLCFFRRGS